MSEAVDLARLRKRYAGGVHLRRQPPVWLFENFASAEEQEALMEAAWEQLRPAEVTGDVKDYISKGRTGSICWVQHDLNAMTLQLAKRISALVNIPLDHAESFQVVHYGPGQEYKAHYDAWDAGTPRGDKCLARGGQRLVTALLYLNHVEAGGATHFPRFKLKVNPLPGNLLLFHNCHAGTTRKHEAALHGGLPVTHGEKWAANLWFRQHRFV